MENRKKIEEILLTDYGCFDDWTVDKLCDLSIVSHQRELLEAYQQFIDWNEEHDRKASTSERIEAFLASNCG